MSVPPLSLSFFLSLNTCFLFRTRITHTHSQSCYFLHPRFVISVYCDLSWLIISLGTLKCHASVICASKRFFIVSDDANRLIVMQPTEIDLRILYMCTFRLRCNLQLGDIIANYDTLTICQKKS